MAHLQKIDKAAACLHLEKFRLVDPLGLATPSSVCAQGECFALDTYSGRLVCVLQLCGSQLWILAAAGTLLNGSVRGLEAIETRARQVQARSVIFQTARPGLVRVTKNIGYSVAQILPAGWVLVKVL